MMCSHKDVRMMKRMGRYITDRIALYPPRVKCNLVIIIIIIIITGASISKEACEIDRDG
jgi:hypothetical protein